MGSKPGPRGYGLDQVVVRFPGAPRVEEGEMEDPGEETEVGFQGVRRDSGQESFDPWNGNADESLKAAPDVAGHGPYDTQPHSRWSCNSGCPQNTGRCPHSPGG